MGRLVDLSARTASVPSAQAAPRPLPCPAPRPAKPIHEWDVAASAMLTIDRGAVPNVACVRYVVLIDPERRAVEVTIRREDWDFPFLIRMEPEPGESAERRTRREAVLSFLNEILSVSYGVPA